MENMIVYINLMLDISKTYVKNEKWKWRGRMGGEEQKTEREK